MVDSGLAGFLAPETGNTSGSDSVSKRKGRPGAAEVETTAEDIKNLKEISGNAAGEAAEAIYFRFLFALKDSAPTIRFCQGAANVSTNGHCPQRLKPRWW